MKKQFLVITILIAASFIFVSCNGAANSNATTYNKANANIANASTNTANNSANNEADIRKMTADAATALNKNDAAALEKIYADDYTLINIDGSMQTRAERLASIKSGDLKYESFAYSDVNVRVYGDTAVVNAVAAIKSTSKGKPIDGKFRVTHVDVKTKDGWRMVNAQTTEIK